MAASSVTVCTSSFGFLFFMAAWIEWFIYVERDDCPGRTLGVSWILALAACWVALFVALGGCVDAASMRPKV